MKEPYWPTLFLFSLCCPGSFLHPASNADCSRFPNACSWFGLTSVPLLPNWLCNQKAANINVTQAFTIGLLLMVLVIAVINIFPKSNRIITSHYSCNSGASVSCSCRIHVLTSINKKLYSTSSKVEDNYDEICKQHIVFDKKLPKWNYRILWQGKTSLPS